MSDVTITLSQENAYILDGFLCDAALRDPTTKFKEIKQALEAGIDAALALDPSPASDLTVRIDANGAAQLRAVDGESVAGITVPRERRREIAADIFGPVTDDLLDRLEDDLPWMQREDIRAVIHAAFGEPA